MGFSPSKWERERESPLEVFLSGGPGMCGGAFAFQYHDDQCHLGMSLASTLYPLFCRSFVRSHSLRSLGVGAYCTVLHTCTAEVPVQRSTAVVVVTVALLFAAIADLYTIVHYYCRLMSATSYYPAVQISWEHEILHSVCTVRFHC